MGCRLVGNNFWKSYFRKNCQIFFKIFFMENIKLKSVYSFGFIFEKPDENVYSYLAGFENYVRCSVYCSDNMTWFWDLAYLAIIFETQNLVKFIRFFKDFFVWKIYNENQYIPMIFFLPDETMYLLILRDLKIILGVQYTVLITWHDFGMSLNWQ